MERFSDVLNQEPLRPIKVSSAALSMTSAVTTNILNVSGERGVLKSVAFAITAAITGTPVITLRVQIDGGTVMDLLLYNGGTTMHADAHPYIAEQGTTAGSSSTANLTWKMDLDLPYNTSCLVAIIVGSVASAGAIDVCVIRKVPV